MFLWSLDISKSYLVWSVKCIFFCESEKNVIFVVEMMHIIMLMYVVTKCGCICDADTDADADPSISYMIHIYFKTRTLFNTLANE